MLGMVRLRNGKVSGAKIAESSFKFSKKRRETVLFGARL